MECLSRVRTRHIPGGTGTAGDENARHPLFGLLQPTESSNAHGFLSQLSGFSNLSQAFVEKCLTCSRPMQALGSRIGSVESLQQNACRFSAGSIADQGCCILHLMPYNNRLSDD